MKFGFNKVTSKQPYIENYLLGWRELRIKGKQIRRDEGTRYTFERE